MFGCNQADATIDNIFQWHEFVARGTSIYHIHGIGVVYSK
jgi:hypothetical protein